MSRESEELIAELLTGVVTDLDLAPGMQEEANRIYDHLGLWLGEYLEHGDWHFYPQGSTRLGTVARPQGVDEYDIDAVAMLATTKDSISQERLRELVGDALEAYVRDRDDEEKVLPTACTQKQRCWTLEFDTPFHLDVLPAIPDSGAPPSGILLSDTGLRNWLFSDPIAYSAWFFERMQTEVRAEKGLFAKRAHVDVDEIPDWQVRTMLQRVVQVLKAHRDCYFAEQLHLRPTSILVTTLAAHAYAGGATLFDAVMETAAQIPSHLDRDGSCFSVLNPVQNQENFADRWTTEDARRFDDWISDLQSTLQEAAATTTGLDGVSKLLGTRFSKNSVRFAAEAFGRARETSRRRGELFIAGTGILGSQGLPIRDHKFHGE